MRRLALQQKLKELLADEDGQMETTPAFMMATMVLAVPMGLVCFYLYAGLCRGAGHANLITGLF